MGSGDGGGKGAAGLEGGLQGWRGGGGGVEKGRKGHFFSISNQAWKSRTRNSQW